MKNEKKCKPGRPCKKTTRGNMHTIRFDAVDELILNQLEDKTGDTASDILRKALLNYYNESKRRGKRGGECDENRNQTV